MPGADQRRSQLAGARALARDEIDEVLRPLTAYPRVGLAVSGGADSMALMHCAAEWVRADASRPRLHVLTVDHGLRAESVVEAGAVAGAARDLGLEASVLAWRGEKPASGIAAAARAARYRLLAEAAATFGLGAIVTAHTLDDQAETLLMRLARGSGIDGLAGMADRTTIDGTIVLRPLLGIAHARLIATLQAAGIAWIDDPSNADDRFERVRIRSDRAALERLGLGPAAIATSARRLARARAALAVQVDAALEPGAGVVSLDPLGFAEIDWAALIRLPDEIRLRVVTKVIEVVAAPPEQVSLSRLEALTEARDWQPPAGRSLAGALFVALPKAVGGDNRIAAIREAGRRPPVEMMLQPGGAAIWDGRFDVVNGTSDHAFVVRALGAAGLAQIEAAGWSRARSAQRVPARVLWSLPAFADATGIVAAVPPLDFRLQSEGLDLLTCRFRGFGGGAGGDRRI